MWLLDRARNTVHSQEMVSGVESEPATATRDPYKTLTFHHSSARWCFLFY